jgi:hypothetical protein
VSGSCWAQPLLTGHPEGLSIPVEWPPFQSPFTLGRLPYGGSGSAWPGLPDNHAGGVDGDVVPSPFASRPAARPGPTRPFLRDPAAVWPAGAGWAAAAQNLFRVNSARAPRRAPARPGRIARLTVAPRSQRSWHRCWRLPLHRLWSPPLIRRRCYPLPRHQQRRSGPRRVGAAPAPATPTPAPAIPPSPPSPRPRLPCRPQHVPTVRGRAHAPGNLDRRSARPTACLTGPGDRPRCLHCPPAPSRPRARHRQARSAISRRLPVRPAARTGLDRPRSSATQARARSSWNCRAAPSPTVGCNLGGAAWRHHDRRPVALTQRSFAG